VSVTWNDAAYIANVRQGAFEGVVTAIGIVEDRWVRLIMGPPKTGRIYRRRGVEHQASAPGEAPASDTGRLVNSRRLEYSQAELRGSMIVSAAHILPLEHGTRKMEPRPSVRRALAESHNEITAAIATSIARRIG
jgi:hypothetical protein